MQRKKTNTAVAPHQLPQLGDGGGGPPGFVALRVRGTRSAGIGFARLGPKTGVRYANEDAPPRLTQARAVRRLYRDRGLTLRRYGRRGLEIEG